GSNGPEIASGPMDRTGDVVEFGVYEHRAAEFPDRRHRGWTGTGEKLQAHLEPADVRDELLRHRHRLASFAEVQCDHHRVLFGVGAHRSPKPARHSVDSSVTPWA